ncbi:MAG: hypothetical protein ABI361_02555 [Nitrososphaera sp.]|jgi:hypothetical protein
MLDPMALHFVGAVAILVAAAVPAYLASKLGGMLRWLTLALAGFCVVHSFYHLAKFVGNDYLGDSVFEPLSVGALLVFGLIFALDITRRKRQQSDQSEVRQK